MRPICRRQSAQHSRTGNNNRQYYITDFQGVTEALLYGGLGMPLINVFIQK